MDKNLELDGRRSGRAVIGCLLLLLFPGIAGASSALLRDAGQGSPPPICVMTYAGKTDLKASSVTLSPAVTFILLVDTIPADQVAVLKKDLLAAYAPARGARLRLGLLQGGNLVFAGPFPTRARFKAALDQIPIAVPSVTPVSGEAITEALFANASQFGSDWSTAVFVGNVPALEPGSLDYAVALLVREFTAQRIRVRWLAATPPPDAWLPLFRATAGSLLAPDLHDFKEAFDSSGAFLQLDWTTSAPSAGFVSASSAIEDQSGAVLLNVPELAATPETMLPTIALYAQLRIKAAEASALLQQPAISDEMSQQLREDLKLALGINPRDPEALLDTAMLYEKFADYGSAAGFRASLAEVRPLDASAHAFLGHDYLIASDLDKAEAALQAALTLGPRAQPIIEDLARIRIARKDDRGALPFLDEVLSTDAKRQDLWFLKAQAGVRLGDSALAITSMEHGLELGGIHIEEVTSLLSLYIKARQGNRASQLANSTLASLPAETGVRTQFAADLEGLNLNPEALAAWRGVLEVQPDLPRAHERITRLLLGADELAAAEVAADAGLAVASHSVDLYLAKAEALERQGYLYQARRTLEQGVELVPEKELVAGLATAQDTFAGLAAPFYEKLAELPKLPSDERVLALQRGLIVALRDADYKHASSFAALLEASNHPEAHALLGNGEGAKDGAMIAGGMAALGFVARAKERVLGERFFVEYSRALIDHAGGLVDQKTAKQYLDGIEQYLQRVSSLEAMGKRDGQAVQITLSLQGKDGRRRTESVLSLLGVKLISGKAGITLDFGESKSQAKKQETLSALGIDQVGMQEAFQAGKPYTLEIPYERAAIYPNEKMWLDTFFAHENQAGGFAGLLAHSMRVARLYVGMSYLDHETIAQLLGAVDLKTLHDRYSDLFFAFAPAFAVHDGRAVCPGGTNAESIWERLAGASTQHPGMFFRALLEHDDGKLLAYFSTLSHLDRSRQEFFTASLARAERFYRLFAAFKERQPGSITTMRDTSYEDFLRSVPLTPNGHVDFPGSPAVWMAAKGHASAESKLAKLSKGALWVGTDVEDDVLQRLAETRYRDKTDQHAELDNFVAVYRINAHRSEPLDDESALLLAQHYNDASGAYAYFTDLTALKAADFRQFFALFDQLRTQLPSDANLRLAQLHALVEWICLLRQREMVTDEQAAKNFRYVLQRFASVGGSEGYAAASLDAVKTILEACKGGSKPASRDDVVRVCLAGSLSARQQEFQRVLELQKVPSLNALFTLYDAANPGGKSSVDDAALNQAASSLSTIDIPAKIKIAGKEKDELLRYNPAALQKVVVQLIQRSSTAKKAGADRDRLRRELVRQLESQVALALSGVVYAYFLRPSDLLVSEDSLLLRKHRYLDFGDRTHTSGNPESEFHPSSEGTGSYFSGGFASFGIAAGDAAGAGWKTGGAGGSEAIAAQIAAIRGTAWDLISESDLRLLGLRVAIAREWIVEAALHPEALRVLNDATMGLLSLSRRADLLNGISARNWPKAWEAITLPDLFALGSVYPQYVKTEIWTSPVTAALHTLSARNKGARLQSLGEIPYRSFGCSHPHWMPLAPYEEYERRFFPVENAERWAEFKLFLAFQADLAGIEASGLSGIAESLAAKAFRSVQMTDFRDWRSLQLGYASITAADVRRAMQ
jgi:Flp pilus assembly protein TadD